MIERKTQLTRDSIVGNEVVSENIYPKTDTSSVTDITNDLPLSESQNIMWNAINNQLTRIVNSVNKRTGVLVLSKKDVGLGNVDNLSFDDMLKRLEALMMETFGKKRMRLFNNLHEVDQFCDRHNKENDYVVCNSPFFSINGYNLDRKSYVGYIFLNEDDPEHPVLEHTQLPVNLSGWADMSMKWDKEWGVRVKCLKCENIMDWDGKPLPDNEQMKCEKCGVVDDPLSPDYPFFEAYTDESNTGRLGINIAKQERYLEVYKPVYTPGTILDEIDKEEGGIRIRPGSLYGRFHYFTGMYGDGTAGSPTHNPLLLRTTDTTGGAPVTIIIQDLDHNDDRKTPFEITARLHPNWLWRDPHDPISPYNKPEDYPSCVEEENPQRIGGLREGDKIFISFRDYRTGNPPVPPLDMDSRLMFRNDHIGVVTSAPSTWNPTAPYKISLNRIRAKVGWGLQHLNDRNNPNDSFITIRLAKGNVGGIISEDIVTNLSGLQVTKGRHDPDITGFDTTSQIDPRFRTINLPTGPHTSFAGNQANRTGGLFINPDASLSIIPHRHYQGGTGADSVVENWKVNAPNNPSHDNGEQTSRHALEENSYVGINTTKLTHRETPSSRWQVGNASGLRVIDAGTSLNMKTFYGVRTTDNHQSQNFNTPHSGGLSVNVGNFLEISPPKYDKTTDKFNEGGKINIRVNPDKGLQAIDACNDNMMAVKINPYRAMHFRNDGTPNTIEEGVVTTGQQGQLEVNIGEVDQLTTYDKRRGLHFNNSLTGALDGRLRINIGNNTSSATNRQRRGLTFASVSVMDNDLPMGTKGRNIELDTKHIQDQEKLKLWLHPRNGLAFRGVKREYASDVESNILNDETTGQLEINYQHLLENMSKHTGRGIIIRNHNEAGINPTDFRIETRLVGQSHTTGNPVEKSLGLEYANDPTRNEDGIKVRPWNGILINNDTAADTYKNANHGVMARIEPQSALMFRPSLNLDGSGSTIENGTRPITINIGQHRDASNTTRRRQGLTFEDGNPIVERHSTGTSSGWSDGSTKLRIWENTFRGMEFRKLPNASEYATSPHLNSIGSKVNDNNMIYPIATVSGNGTITIDNTNTVGPDGSVKPINPAMDMNENELTGMLQVKIHGGIRFRFRGNSWNTTNNTHQSTITNDTNANGLARTPTRQEHQHGRLETQMNRARGLNISTVESPSNKITTSDIYPSNGTNIGDLQMNINEKTGLRFTADNITDYPIINNSGDVRLNGKTISNFKTPSVTIAPHVENVPSAIINVPAFSVSNGSIPSDTTISEPLPDGMTVTFPSHDITIAGNKLNIPARSVLFADTSVTVPERYMDIQRNTATLKSMNVVIGNRNITIPTCVPTLEWHLQPVNPITLPALTYPTSFIAGAKTISTSDTLIPHDQFTEDDRIIIKPEMHRLSEAIVINTNSVTIPSYQTYFTWSAVGSNGTTYTITKRVTVPSRTVLIPNKTITANTILQLYEDGNVFVRIPESDRFNRDQGKLRLIIDPNQGLGFNPRANTGAGTINENSSKNPHDWQLNNTRRDINALRIKINMDKGIQFRTDGVSPHNTYNLDNSFNDNTNKAGTNGQLEIKLNTKRGLGFRTDGSTNNTSLTTGASILPTSGTNGQIEMKINTGQGLDFDEDGNLYVKIGKGLIFNTPGTTDGKITTNLSRGLEFEPMSGNNDMIRSKRWWWEFNYTGGEQIITLPKGKYDIECWGAQGGGYNGTMGTTRSYFSGGKGTYIRGQYELVSDNTTLYVGVGKAPDTARGGWPHGGDVAFGSFQHGVPVSTTDKNSGGYGGGGCSYINTFPKEFDVSPNGDVPYFHDAMTNVYKFLEFAVVSQDTGAGSSVTFDVKINNTHLQRSATGGPGNVSWGGRNLNWQNNCCVSLHLAKMRTNTAGTITTVTVLNSIRAKVVDAATGITHPFTTKSRSDVFSSNAGEAGIGNLITRQNLPVSFGDFWPVDNGADAQAQGTISIEIPYGSGTNEVRQRDMIGFIYINWGAGTPRHINDPDESITATTPISKIAHPDHTTTIHMDHPFEDWSGSGNVVGFLGRNASNNVITVSSIPLPTMLFLNGKKPFIVAAGGGGASMYAQGNPEYPGSPTITTYLGGGQCSLSMKDFRDGAGGSGIEGGTRAGNIITGGYSGRSALAGVGSFNGISLPIDLKDPSKVIRAIDQTFPMDPTAVRKIIYDEHHGDGYVRITKLD